MITEEQYNEACKIIDQYHLERQQEAENELDEEDNWDQDDEDDRELELEMERYATALNCKCGAWVISKTTGQAIHIADCCCGAE